MGRPAKYRVTLTEEERNQLTEITHSGKRSVKLILHAQALLALDQGAFNPAPKTIDDVASVINISRQSLIKIKERFVLEGLDAALNRKKQDKPSRKIVFDGDFEAKDLLKYKILNFLGGIDPSCWEAHLPPTLIFLKKTSDSQLS